MKSKKGFALSVLLVFFICGVTIPLFMTNHTKINADSVTTLTDTTWVLNTNITKSPSGWTFSGSDDESDRYRINFVSNNTSFYEINFIGEGMSHGAIYYTNYPDTSVNVTVYPYPSLTWINDAYRTITFTGEVTGGGSQTTLINWLQNNATQQVAPSGTQISHRYWSPYGVISMQDNQRIGDDDIEYTVLFNEFTDSYDETVQTGLIFLGVQIDDPNVQWSYIESINGSGINILYHGVTNNINNAMWLEFTPGDYIDTQLYDLMDLYGHWFDDDDAYLVGMNQGYVEGLQNGRALGQADGVEYTGLITGIFNGLGNILSIQVFPNITIGLLIGLPLLLGAFIIIIKILRG